jgi:dolichyl-phosphate-mannose--protein O-mannosyl transferase
MPAIFGVLAVLILTRTARRMFRSTMLGAMAGLLMALDGMEFVLSRTAILDIFVMFFVLIAFACIVLDRDQRRARWLREMENGLDPTRGGVAGRPRWDWRDWRSVPWWRLAAGVLLGLGCGVKWSVIFFIPVFIGLTLLWEVGLRRTVGARHPWRDTLLDETGWFAAMVALSVVAYLATWTGWFAGNDGWDRHYMRDQLHQREPWLFGALYNLWKYQMDVYHFHVGLTSPHPYQSEPWQWLLLGRPVAFYWNGDPTCGASKCAAEILLLGTPVLWWAFLPALALTIWFGVSRRDWRALAIWGGVAGGLLPWFYYSWADDRTMYYFYALPAEPFLVLAVTYVFGCLITGPGVGRFGYGQIRPSLAIPTADRRMYGVIAAGVFVVLVAICFWIYYPLYVGDSIPYDEWYKRMLLGNRWV